MEHQDRVQRAEFISNNTQIEANDNRMEDDTELENQKRRDLLSERVLSHFLSLSPRPRNLR